LNLNLLDCVAYEIIYALLLITGILSKKVNSCKFYKETLVYLTKVLLVSYS